MKIEGKSIRFVHDVILGSFPVFYYVVIFQYLPTEIPIHYTFDGVADRFVPKLSVEAFVVCALGYVGLFLGMILRKLVLVLEKTQRNRNVKSTNTIMTYNQTILTVLFSALSTYFIVIIQKNMVPDRYYIWRVVYLALSNLLLILGNYLPKIKRNTLFGVKTQYSQSDDHAWIVTQRFSGRLFIAGGIAILVVCLLPTISTRYAVIVSTILVAMIFLGLTAFSLRKQRHSGQT